MLALVITLLVAMFAVIISFLIGFCNETCWALSKDPLNEFPVMDKRYKCVVLIRRRTRVLQAVIFLALVVATGWALLPVVYSFDEGNGMILIASPAAAALFQFEVLNRVACWASNLSMKVSPDKRMRTLKKAVEPNTVFAVSRHW